MNVFSLILKNEWKAAFRSPVWHRKLFVNILLALMFLYLAGNMLFVGIMLDDIMMKIPVEGIDHRTFPGDWVLRKLNRYLLYYFLADMVIRYLMQKLPAMSIQPYLHLPMKKDSLITLMLAKTMFNPFNIFQFLILGPFMIEVLQNLDSTAAALGWVFGVCGIIVAWNFLAVYLKRSADVDWRVFVAFLATLILIVVVHAFDLVDFAAVSASIFNTLFLYPITAIAPWLLVVFAYWINYRFLKQNMYLSSISKTKGAEVKYAGDGILSRFGIVGKLAENEFKFIWRNKRSRTSLIMSAFFILYGVLLIQTNSMESEGEKMSPIIMYILLGLVSTGMFIMNYGQYLLGWDAAHFDHVLTRRLSFENYYKGKFMMFFIVTTTFTILNIPYVYFGWKVLLAVAAVALLNLGFIVHIVMFFGSFNPKKIDLNQGSAMNWQGVGAAQFLMVIPAMGFPVGLYFVLSVFFTDVQSLTIMGVVGIIGMLATNLWMKLLASWLRNRRHEISQDFRSA